MNSSGDRVGQDIDEPKTEWSALAAEYWHWWKDVSQRPTSWFALATCGFVTSLYLWTGSNKILSALLLFVVAGCMVQVERKTEETA